MRVTDYIFQLRTAGTAGLAALVALSSAQAAPTLHFFTLGNSQMSPAKVAAIASAYKFTQLRSVTGAPLPMWADADGSVRQIFANNELQVLPDLKLATAVGPTLAEAAGMSTKFLSQFGLLPDDVSKWNFGETISWTKIEGTPDGKTQRGVSPLRSIRFQRMLDNLPVFGKNSSIGTTCDKNALIGLLHTVRPVSTSPAAVRLKTPDQIDGELQMDINNILSHSPGTAKVLSKTLCYFDQGARYVQPAYRCRVEITGENGDKQGEELFIPAAMNSPEPVFEEHFNGFDPVIPEDMPTGAAAPMVTNVKLGEYVVRQDADQDICLSIANGFYNNSSTGAAITGRSVTRSQYYWDHDWLWTKTNTHSDQSQFYPGKVDFAVVVAHGQPWGFSSLSNSGEWVDLHNMNHFGQAVGVGNPSHDYTSYMLFTSCSMMPAPSDPHGGYYKAGEGAFGVYWNMFWGMHGIYGFRTTAGKSSCNSGFASFGLLAGLRVPLAGAWMNVTSGLDHGSNWNYGTAVFPTGRSSDTMFDTQALPKATSLTMWWNHP